MQNLDQIRAAAAYAAKDDTSKQAVAKLPAMIMGNGLLAAAAFANEVNRDGVAKRGRMQAAMASAARHLKHPIHGITAIPEVADEQTPREVIDNLTHGLTSGRANSMDLQRATTETLAFLSFLKRYTVNEEAED